MTGSNLTIFRKGLLLVGLSLTFQLGLLAFLLQIQADANEAQRWSIHTRDVIAQVDEAYQLLTEAVSHMRGVVLTGDPSFAPELEHTAERVTPALDRLENLVSDNPGQVARVHELRGDASELLKWVVTERQLVGAGRTGEAVARAAAGVGEQTFQKVHERLEAIFGEEQRLDRERLGRVGRARREGYWVVGTSAAVMIALAGAALGVFSRGVASRLATLADNAGRLADHEPFTPADEGGDEIARVDQAFRAAADRLAAAEAGEKRYRAELERRALELAAANSDLARANDDLRFKTQEIETFVYSVSHDLRSPLVNLQGFGKELSHTCEELRALMADPAVPVDLRQRMTALIDGDVLESVRFIQTAVSRSGNIIDALLRLSRAGRVEYKRQRVNVRAIVERVVEAMQSSVRERKAEVLVHDLPDANADPTAVEQVFGNLLGNAVNYLDRGRAGRIEVGALSPAEGDGNWARYYVRDNGMGIPASYLPKMFVAFQRLHGQIAPGEGVGLALVHRIVERLGGSVSVESTEHVGSTFIVNLPAAPNSRTEPGLASTPSDEGESANRKET